MNLAKLFGTLAMSLALMAIAAPGASAASGEFIHSQYPNSVHAFQTTKHVLNITNGSPLECATVNLDGASQSGPSNELVLTPTYEGCKAFGHSATVTTNGCTYRLTEPAGAGDNWSGGLAIKCPVGKKITISVSNAQATCKVEIGEQTLAGGITYKNDTATGELDLVFNLTGIEGSVVASSGLCPLMKGTHENVTYTGGSTAEASEGGNVAIGVFGPGEFIHSKYPNSVHAFQTTKHVLTLPGAKVECTTVSLNGTSQSGPASELTLTPTYEGCTAFGFAGTVITNGCTYRLTQSEGFGDSWSGGFAIKCPAGKKITISVNNAFAKCTAEIGEQTPAGSVAYENDTVAGEIDLTFNLSGIEATVVTSTGLCPLTVGTHKTTTYTGGSTAEASEGGNVAIG